MNGYTGKIGVVDLTQNKTSTIETEEDLIKCYLGGRGFVMKFLFDLIPDGADPLGEENVLVFGSGPLNGTLSPTGGRWMVGAKSPATGILVSGNGGGMWGAEIKWAGFDALVIKGRAKEPCYLMVSNDTIEILPARDLWGKDTWEAEEIIQAHHSDPQIRVMSIGIAGENQVPMASVFSEKVHHGGRGGTGAVMGSKNLKAVAVRGTKGVDIADPKALIAEAAKINEIIKTESQYPIYSKFGSPRNTTAYAKLGGLTTRNGQSGTFEGFEKIEAQNFHDRTKLMGYTKCCFSCSMPCFHQHLVSEGKYTGVFGSGLQNSTIQCFGTKIGNDNPAALFAFHIKADRYGLDEISAGLAIAFAMECYQRKIITSKDIDGMELEWGNDEAVMELLGQMARGEGLGKILGQGTQHAARKLGGGSEKFALQVKNLEISTVDPRVFPGWALGYAVASRGADHMRAFSTWEFGGSSEDDLMKITGSPTTGERSDTANKGRGVAFSEDMRAVTDCLQMCKTFSARKIGMPETFVGLLNAVTGRGWTEAQLLQIGERINNLERLFNLRNGMKPTDDTLPARVLEEPLSDGASKGMVVDLEPLLDEYYHARDWSRDTGYPSPEKLNQLGLDKYRSR
jgi:aldehyde:ferredoxin oxidoreductase